MLGLAVTHSAAKEQGRLVGARGRVPGNACERPGVHPPGRSNPGVKFGHCQMRRYSAPSGGSAPLAADGAASRCDPSRDPVPIHDHAGRVVTRNVKSNCILCHCLHLRY